MYQVSISLESIGEHETKLYSVDTNLVKLDLFHFHPPRSKKLIPFGFRVKYSQIVCANIV